MTTLTDFLKVDGVDYPLAEYFNFLYSAALRAEMTNTQTITATKELTDNDVQFQVITASGADRTVELAPEASSNHVTIIYNAGGSNNVIVKDDSGAVTFITLLPGQWGFFLPFLGLTWKILGSPRVLEKIASFSNHSPLDVTTYYFGPWGDGLAPTTTADVRRTYITKAGILRVVDILIRTTGTLGTNEASTMYFRLNNTTDTAIATTLDLSGATFHVQNTALNVAVAAGDYFEIKWVTPTWATNPTGVYGTASLLFDVN